MNFSMIRYILGWILNLQAGFMLLPAITAFIYKEQDGVWFLLVAAGLLLLGLPCVLFKAKKKVIRAKEGFVTVSLAWIILSLTGALPYLLTGKLVNFVDCIFETVSGYTTTGASIVNNMSEFSHALNFWHCFTIWIGGMGVLVFMLAVLPLAGGESIHIMRAETPGPIVSKLVPKMKDSATILYLIYVALTFIEIAVLRIVGLKTFDSICIALSNAGTGGFGVDPTGVMNYTPTQQIVLVVFMILFSINFNVYFLLLMRKPKDALLKNEELRVFLGLVCVSSITIAVNIRTLYSSFGEAFRHSIFQVASIMSTTGFVSADFDEWPTLSRTILVILMFVGACAGSTCGGIKISRYIILGKNFFRELVSYIHPKNVRVIKIDGKKISNDTIKMVQNYTATFVIVFAVSLLFLSIEGNTGLVTNFTAVASCMNNVGPGLDAVGPVLNYANLTIFQKTVLSIDMLIGRLELFPILILCLPSTWRKN